MNRHNILVAFAGTLVVGACAARPRTPPSLTACLGSGAGGGVTGRGEHELVYAVRQDSSGMQLDAAVVVRASREWRRRPPSDSAPRPPRADGLPRGMNGATVGPLWIGYEPATGALWLDSLPIPLHPDNVVLLEVGVDDVPRVVGRARVESHFPLSPPASCSPSRTLEEHRAFRDALWEVVRRAPAAREFLDGSGNDSP